ncbi:hypothetical protein [Hymenobacter translucens]|uniref:hypothetical protein n=1 Tax=Hymenobacter translucens TaxID=2886507 RepID=UPI001D0E637F|nr:hypothetical protein [Hymenobacter translucens]
MLDAAGSPSGVPNVVVGGAITAVVAVVGWMVKRIIEASDVKTERLETAVTSLTRLVGEIGQEQKASAKLAEYLEKRVDTLEKKKEVLEKSFYEMDKIIDREIIHKKLHPPHS